MNQFTPQIGDGFRDGDRVSVRNGKSTQLFEVKNAELVPAPNRATRRAQESKRNRK